MRKEKSCGAIVYRILDGEPWFLILRHSAGHWSFAKGHIEAGETEVETAVREIKEETGLPVILDENFRITSEYSPKVGTTKQVVFFIAQAEIGCLALQTDEIHEAMWCTYEDALSQLTYKSDQDLLTSSYRYLRSKI